MPGVLVAAAVSARVPNQWCPEGSIGVSGFRSPGKQPYVGRRIGQPQLVRTRSALDVDLDFRFDESGVCRSPEPRRVGGSPMLAGGTSGARAFGR